MVETGLKKGRADNYPIYKYIPPVIIVKKELKEREVIGPEVRDAKSQRGFPMAYHYYYRTMGG